MTRETDSETIDAVLRNGLYPFLIAMFPVVHPGERIQEARYLEALCYALERSLAGDLRRLAVTLPPRHLKSFLISAVFIAWALGRDPTKKFLVASYSEDLARQLSRMCRQIMESRRYRRLFPDVRLRRATDLILETTAGGGRRGVSASGTVTGTGADILIIDDPMRADDVHSDTLRDSAKRLFGGTLSTRLNNPHTGQIIIVAQRLHEDDLIDHVINRDDYELLDFPARAVFPSEHPIGLGRIWRREPGDFLCPERFGEQAFAEARLRLGEADFEAQYQQNPVPPGGGRFDLASAHFYEGAIDRSDYSVVIQSWDTASGTDPRNDYSVCTTWGLHRETEVWRLIDLWRAKLAYHDLRAMVIHLHRRWIAARVLVEYADVGRPLVQELRGPCPVVQGQRVHDPKAIRFEANIGRLYEGHVALPRDAQWSDALLHELRAFPNGRHDDQVDRVVQFLQWIGSAGSGRAQRFDPGTGEWRIVRRKRANRRSRPLPAQPRSAIERLAVDMLFGGRL